MWLQHSLTLPGASGHATYPYKQTCEDSAGAWWAADALILTVADGLQSKLRSAEASNLAVALVGVHTIGLKVLEGATMQSRMESLQSVFRAVQSDFLARIQREPDADQWRTTLAVVAVLSRAEVYFCSMGDSMLLLRVRESPAAAAHLVQAQEVSRGVGSPAGTRTLADSSDHCTARAIHVPECIGVFLSTDGLEKFIDSSQPSGWTQRPLFEQILDHLADQDFLTVSQGLSHPKVRSRKGDDIGVAMAAWRETAH